MKLIRIEEIVEVVERNVLYSWEMRLIGSVGFIGVVEDLYGNKRWYKKGELHRIDGPAIEYSDGSKEWFKEGKYHRLDGPAIEWINETKHWYIEGIRYSSSEFERKKVCLEF